MDQFEANYQMLNAAQKEAVDHIDGPLMVIAGPGTGKTQLLSLRVANILRQTDTSSSNILCLTFTESGALAMQQRLIGLMGREAYGVAVHTFHGFGREVINTYGRYFYHGASFLPADELSCYEILRELFDKLPHDNPLKVTMNGEYTYLRDTQSTISDLKRSGLTPDELLKVLEQNDAYIEWAEPKLAAFFEQRLSKQSIAAAQPLTTELDSFQAEVPLPTGHVALGEVASSSFARAARHATETSSTRPLSLWRSQWLERDNEGKLVCKDRARSRRLRAVAGLYYDYLVAMQERSLYDFDDMILRVVHATEVFADLRYDLQERYQYILVDEFQDTNGAQLRLLLNLATSESNDAHPNIMVVGDDDQAIYAFQGAEIGNFAQFERAFPARQLVTLRQNYRSDQVILDAARAIITQGEERLENQLKDIDKSLIATHKASPATAEIIPLPDELSEYSWIASDISARLSAAPTTSIAILGRHHSQLTKLLPYLNDRRIVTSYERRDNVLEQEPIQLLTLVATVLVDLASQDFEAVEANLPELLAHPAWHIPPADLWQVSLRAHKEKRYWLELMLEHKGTLREIAEWLVIGSHLSLKEPLETMIDRIVGTNELQAPDSEQAEPAAPLASGPREDYTSPLRDYYFNRQRLEANPTSYLVYLRGLTTIRRHLRTYAPDRPLLLKDFVHFIALHHETSIGMRSDSDVQQSPQIQLMTAHKAKGLEFDIVYILSGQDSIWGSTARSRHRLITFPHNLPLNPAGSNEDERLRLLYVSMTRARDQLLITTYAKDAAGRDSHIAKYLHVPALAHRNITSTKTIPALVHQTEVTWHDRLAHISPSTMSELLAPALERYHLSSTHLNNFIDVTSGGPQTFLLHNLLRFPQNLLPQTAYGSAIHATLQKAHAHLSATGKRRPVEDILHDFEASLSHQRLARTDFEHYLRRGSDILHVFLTQRYDTFTPEQIAERDFAGQGAIVGQARLAGIIDLIEIDNQKRITVTDYKTGKASHNWRGKTDFEKIKLHKYRQQLMFYKLLIENARDFGPGYQVEVGRLEFVEAGPDSQIHLLELAYDTEEVAAFTRLIQAVWQRIIHLDLPDTSGYEQSYKGILAFEEDLLNYPNRE